MPPLYDYRCDKCDYEFERLLSIADRNAVRCERCSAPVRRVISVVAEVHIFKPGWWEHLALKPIYISSKKQLKKECDKHGKESVYLLDS